MKPISSHKMILPLETDLVLVQASCFMKVFQSTVTVSNTHNSLILHHLKQEIHIAKSVTSGPYMPFYILECTDLHSQAPLETSIIRLQSSEYMSCSCLIKSQQQQDHLAKPLTKGNIKRHYISIWSLLHYLFLKCKCEVLYRLK